MLHPRFEIAQQQRVLTEIVPRVLELARFAKANNMALTIDIEEADRLMLTLAVFSAVYQDSALEGWEGLGLALQAYQKRAMGEGEHTPIWPLLQNFCHTQMLEEFAKLQIQKLFSITSVIPIQMLFSRLFQV